MDFVQQSVLDMLGARQFLGLSTFFDSNMD